MKAPFPWFGGKRRISPEVWAALGDVDHYVEPFAGSLAVLLERPPQHEAATSRTETVNDADAYIANFWRAVASDPDAVAQEADWPVSETDLFARHLWLVSSGRERLAALDSDPAHYDVRVAGWWVWGQCAWIGSGWCFGDGPWTVVDGHPHLGNAGRGVNRQLPHLGDAGRGVVHSAGDMSAGGSGAPLATWDRAHWRQGEEPPVYGYMRALQARLRRVRVCCGDWSRVVTDGALAYGATIGVFVDPPYDEEVRTRGLYSTEGGSLSADVRAWALARGDDPRLRIALCGYDGEHEMPTSWRVHEWRSSGAYLGGSVEDSPGRLNRGRERVWFSPSCLAPAQRGLFTMLRGTG